MAPDTARRRMRVFRRRRRPRCKGGMGGRRRCRMGSRILRRGRERRRQRGSGSRQCHRQAWRLRRMQQLTEPMRLPTISLAASLGGHLAAVLSKPDFDFCFSLSLSLCFFLLLFCWIEFCHQDWPGVVRVVPNRVLNLHTTRSWDFMG